MKDEQFTSVKSERNRQRCFQYYNYHINVAVILRVVSSILRLQLPPAILLGILFISIDSIYLIFTLSIKYLTYNLTSVGNGWVPISCKEAWPITLGKWNVFLWVRFLQLTASICRAHILRIWIDIVTVVSYSNDNFSSKSELPASLFPSTKRDG